MIARDPRHHNLLCCRQYRIRALLTQRAETIAIILPIVLGDIILDTIGQGPDGYRTAIEWGWTNINDVILLGINVEYLIDVGSVLPEGLGYGPCRASALIGRRAGEGWDLIITPSIEVHKF